MASPKFVPPCSPAPLCLLAHQTMLLKTVFSHQRSSDGSLSHEEDLARAVELQELIDKQAREQSQMKERLAALSRRVAELEEDLDTARKDLIKSEEVNTKLQREVRMVSGGRAAVSSPGRMSGDGRFDCWARVVPDPPSCFQPWGYCRSDSRAAQCYGAAVGWLPFCWCSLLAPRSQRAGETWSCWSLGLGAAEWTPCCSVGPSFLQGPGSLNLSSLHPDFLLTHT